MRWKDEMHSWRSVKRSSAGARPDSVLSADAFIHLPNLRDRVTDPEQSLLRLTPEMFAMWERRAKAAGFPAGWRLPDEVIERSRLALLGDGAQTPVVLVTHPGLAGYREHRRLVKRLNDMT